MSIEQQSGYQMIGEGKDLVLVHGWGVSSAIWKPVVESLSQHYRIHLVDLPGFGDAPTLTDYSLASMSEALLSQLPEKAIWCGWSLGGLIATYIASHFPQRVEKLVQVCSSVKFVQQEDWLGVEKNAFDAFKKGVESNPMKTLNRFLTLQAMGSKTAKNDVATLKGLLLNQPQADKFALLAGLDLLNKVDLRSELSKISMPCLSISGQFDTLVPIANNNAVLALNSNIQQIVFSASSHAPFISETEAFNKTLLEFIA